MIKEQAIPDDIQEGYLWPVDKNFRLLPRITEWYYETNEIYRIQRMAKAD